MSGFGYVWAPLGPTAYGRHKLSAWRHIPAGWVLLLSPCLRILGLGVPEPPADQETWVESCWAVCTSTSLGLHTRQQRRARKLTCLKYMPSRCPRMKLLKLARLRSFDVPSPISFKLDFYILNLSIFDTVSQIILCGRGLSCAVWNV